MQGRNDSVTAREHLPLVDAGGIFFRGDRNVMEFEEYEKNYHLRPSRFRLDGEGHYWEPRDMGRGIMWVAAPPFAGYINFYLFEGPDIIIERHMKPLCDVPELKLGATPRDDGNLILSDEEKTELLRTDPLAEKFIRPFVGAREFINRIPRWCLWLLGAEPADIRKCPRVLERIEGVRQFRLKSKRAATRKQAETPMLFSEIRYSTTDYLAIPSTSSSNRKYIPIAWLPSDVIASNAMFMCENSTLYQFGVISSSVHMAWVRKISGRLRNDYRYSNTLDYNAFPWPVIHEVPWMPEGNPARLAIEKTARRSRSLPPKLTCRPLRRTHYAPGTAQSPQCQRRGCDGRVRVQADLRG